MKKRMSWKTGVCAAVLALSVTVGGISAYFTDTEEKLNKFTVGKIDIELQEPKWDKKPDQDKNGVPDEAEHMTPNQSVEKDPQVKNTGLNDAYVYLTVEVPGRNLITVNNDGTKNPKGMHQLFNYEINKEWMQLGSYKVMNEKGEQTGIRYLYAYAAKDGTCTAVKPKEITRPLFDKVSLINVMEGQGLEEAAFDIKIQAYGIQTSNLNGGTTNAGEIWKVITNQRELSDTYK